MADLADFLGEMHSHIPLDKPVPKEWGWSIKAEKAAALDERGWWTMKNLFGAAEPENNEAPVEEEEGGVGLKSEAQIALEEVAVEDAEGALRTLLAKEYCLEMKGQVSERAHYHPPTHPPNCPVPSHITYDA